MSGHSLYLHLVQCYSQHCVLYTRVYVLTVTYIHVHVYTVRVYTCIIVLIVPQNDLNSVKWLAVFCDEVQVIKVISVHLHVRVYLVPYHTQVHVYIHCIHVYTDLVYWPLLICLRGCTLKSPLP